MASENNEGVKHIERVEVTPAEGDDETIEAEETDPASPQGNEGGSDDEGEVDPENDPADASPDGKPEGLKKRPTTPGNQTPAAPAAPEPTNQFGIKRLPDETLREFGMRLELTKTRAMLRKERAGEILDTLRPNAPSPASGGQLSEAAQRVIGKYKPEELAALREVLPVLAGEMGFVRKDELAGSSYADKAQEELDAFVEKHPEYKPENDPEGATWAAFREEFADRKQPANPKELRKLFEKVHQSVFGIQAGGTLPAVQAQQQKVQVASHAGASVPTAPARQRSGGGRGNGLRLDALKGFDEETKQRIAQRANED